MPPALIKAPFGVFFLLIQLPVDGYSVDALGGGFLFRFLVDDGLEFEPHDFECFRRGGHFGFKQVEGAAECAVVLFQSFAVDVFCELLSHLQKCLLAVAFVMYGEVYSDGGLGFPSLPA